MAHFVAVSKSAVRPASSGHLAKSLSNMVKSLSSGFNPSRPISTGNVVSNNMTANMGKNTYLPKEILLSEVNPTKFEVAKQQVVENFKKYKPNFFGTNNMGNINNTAANNINMGRNIPVKNTYLPKEVLESELNPSKFEVVKEQVTSNSGFLKYVPVFTGGITMYGMYGTTTSSSVDNYSVVSAVDYHDKTFDFKRSHDVVTKNMRSSFEEVRNDVSHVTVDLPAGFSRSSFQEVPQSGKMQHIADLMSHSNF